LQVWQFSHDCRSSVVLCNAPLRSFVGLLWVLCCPLRSFAVFSHTHWAGSSRRVTLFGRSIDISVRTCSPAYLLKIDARKATEATCEADGSPGTPAPSGPHGTHRDPLTYLLTYLSIYLLTDTLALSTNYCVTKSTSSGFFPVSTECRRLRPASGRRKAHDDFRRK